MGWDGQESIESAKASAVINASDVYFESARISEERFEEDS